MSLELQSRNLCVAALTYRYVEKSGSHSISPRVKLMQFLDAFSPPNVLEFRTCSPFFMKVSKKAVEFIGHRFDLDRTS